MPDPDLSGLKTLLESPEFAAVKQAAEALPAELMLDRSVGPHLNAFLTGARALARIEFAEPEGEGGE